jgi:hypothetical protein
MILHAQIYKDVMFFKGKDKSFIAWMSSVLRPFNVEDQAFIYNEMEEVTESKQNNALVVNI